MYSPSVFTISDPDVIRAFVRRHGFGILISRSGSGWEDTHTSLLVAEDLSTITGHIARANPQWRAWEEHPRVKVVFHGPHAYVSPRYYVSEFNVPTWNYSAVSIDGRIRMTENREESVQIIQDLVAEYEGPSGWKLDLEDERYMKLLEAVVCFSIDVERVEAKFKMNQNKPDEDRESVIANLAKSPCGLDRETAGLMRQMRRPGVFESIDRTDS